MPFNEFDDYVKKKHVLKHHVEDRYATVAHNWRHANEAHHPAYYRAAKWHRRPSTTFRLDTFTMVVISFAIAIVFLILIRRQNKTSL
jgi:hypothetical protein